jgi:hypothetical protein
LKIYLDLVFGKLVFCKERRGFEAKKPLGVLKGI